MFIIDSMVVTIIVIKSEPSNVVSTYLVLYLVYFTWSQDRLLATGVNTLVKRVKDSLIKRVVELQDLAEKSSDKRNNQLNRLEMCNFVRMAISR